MALINDRGDFLPTCNVSACNQDLKETAWITRCMHIFCNHCGERELKELPANCPICSHQLLSPFDVFKGDLNPPAYFIKMVLMGLSPTDCLSAAHNGIQFWESQMSQQLDRHRSAAYTARLQLADVQRYYETKVADMNEEIALLQEQCNRMRADLSRSSTPPLINEFRTESDNLQELFVTQNAAGKTERSDSTNMARRPYPSAPPRNTSQNHRDGNRPFFGEYFPTSK